MNKRLFKTFVALLAIAAAAAGPVRGQTTYNVTFSGFNYPELNTTVNVASLPQTFTSNFNPPSVIDDVCYGFTNAYVTSGGEDNVSASVVTFVEMSITVSGTFEGTATIHVTGKDDEERDISTDVYVSCVAVAPAAPTPHTVRMAEGTEDVGNWSITPEAAAITGVTEGAVVTVKYNGTRRINSIEAMVDGPSLTTPLTMEALTDGTIEVNMNGSSTLSTGMKYAVNGGEKTLITTTTTITVNAGDKVQFYGNGTSTTEYGNNPEVNLRGTAETKVYGNIMSLLDETGYETATAISGNYVFYALFRNNANLKDASGLLLPAMTLANNCYSNMFHGCTGLTEAPVLPAQTLVSGCYNAMFYNCRKLNSVTCLATSGINASSSTSYWLEDAGTDQSVTTKTFNAVSSAEWPTSVNGIPEGWTRQVIGAQSTPEPVTLVPTGNTNEWTLTMPADNMLLMVNYATTHTVRFADGNDGWQVQDVTAATSAVAPAVLENVIAGDSLVVTAPATLPGKVKSVKAVKYVAPAATVATEPTATEAYIEVGSTAALVNAGVANGGTMMYAVTTTNAQPASTADFSATRPTAEGRTAGTYYVWYYAKADANHSDSEIAGPVSVTLAVMTTVTWNSSNIGGSYPNCLNVSGTSTSYTKEGITLSANANMNNAEWMDYGDESMNGIAFQMNESGGYTFTAPTGKKFIKIEMTLTNQGGWGMASLGTGWAYGEDYMYNIYKATWKGSAASTVGLLTGAGNFAGATVKSIVFTLIDAQ